VTRTSDLAAVRLSAGPKKTTGYPVHNGLRCSKIFGRGLSSCTMEAGATANPAVRPRKETISASGSQLRPPQSASAPRRALVTIRTPMNSSSPHLGRRISNPSRDQSPIATTSQWRGQFRLSLSGSAQFIPSQHLEIVHRVRDFRHLRLGWTPPPQTSSDTSFMCVHMEIFCH
jgi:hypothetical protein